MRANVTLKKANNAMIDCRPTTVSRNCPTEWRGAYKDRRDLHEPRSVLLEEIQKDDELHNLVHDERAA
jgi:hypothetical protein